MRVHADTDGSSARPPPPRAERALTAKALKRLAWWCRAWTTRASCLHRLDWTAWCGIAADACGSRERVSHCGSCLPRPLAPFPQPDVPFAFLLVPLGLALLPLLLGVPLSLYLWTALPWRKFEAMQVRSRQYPDMPRLNKQVMGTAQGGVLVPKAVSRLWTQTGSYNAYTCTFARSCSLAHAPTSPPRCASHWPLVCRTTASYRSVFVSISMTRRPPPFAATG